ncbi:hypothetical protein Cni_G10101 [Canna indica]|uniref:Uncharacterized protein n=1 Tax=Canna indica TaxID=4628 RepID=A0AAQ3K5K0_9LILI|nr:hypothetical protein Cni_G10101 [Canna indica]
MPRCGTHGVSSSRNPKEERNSWRSSSRRASPSPEFEFCIAPEPKLLTADELFANGLLLPLHLLHLRHSSHTSTLPCETEPAPQPHSTPEPMPPPRAAPPRARTSASCSSASGSRWWKDIFKLGDKKSANEKERRSGGRGVELVIWPFSRSRSAGSAATAAGRTVYGRKAISAPCSRSNSRGEFYKSAATAAAGRRRWAASPGRAGGVHVGRSCQLWQIRPGSKGVEPAVRRRPEQRGKVTISAKDSGGGVGVKVHNLSANACIGYRCHVACKGES